jgi:hypothetical protein
VEHLGVVFDAHRLGDTPTDAPKVPIGESHLWRFVGLPVRCALQLGFTRH